MTGQMDAALIGIAGSCVASTQTVGWRSPDLSGDLRVAPETVRRDLRLLEGQGLLQRVTAGPCGWPSAPCPRSTGPHPSTHLGTSGWPHWWSIPACPGHLVPRRLAAHLGGGRGVEPTPACGGGTDGGDHGLDVAVVLSRVANLQVYNIGGSVEPEHRGQQGEWALDEIRRFRVDLALLSPSGVSIGGVFAASTMAAAIDAAAIESSQQVWLLMEGHHVGRAGVVRVASIDEVSRVFAAGYVDGAQVEAFREAEIPMMGPELTGPPPMGAQQPARHDT